MADVFQQYNKRNAPSLNDIRGHLSVDLWVYKVHLNAP